MKIQLQLKQVIKYSNFIIFAIVLILFFILQPHKKFSLEIVSMLTADEKELYQLSEKFNHSKVLLMAVQGFEKKDLEKIESIKKELSSLPQIFINNQLNNSELKEYNKKYKIYLNELNYTNSSDIDVKNKLTNLYNNLVSSPIYFNINKEDPLNIISKNEVSSKIKFKNGNLILNDYGYLSVFSIKSNNDEKSRVKTYDDIDNILSKYKNVKSFSSFYYYVENSREIKNDVKKIIITSMILLGILYLIMLRNLYLFMNVGVTLVSSVIMGQIVISYIFPEASIITLAFGTAITSVSIDYMFHHYLHNYYCSKKKFNKSVFYGFMTTVTAFILISCIDFPLIKQIAVFTVVSLTVAYVHFSFIYPYLGIKHIEPYSKEKYKNSFEISVGKIIIFSFVIILIAMFTIKFDFNIRNLDYKNQELINTENFFKSKLNENKKSPILITGSNIDEVISNAKIIQSMDKSSMIPLSSLLSKKEYLAKKSKLEKFNFSDLNIKLNKISYEVGLKRDYFKKTYDNAFLYPTYPNYSKQMIESFGMDLIYHENKFITYAMVNPEKLDKILSFDFTKSVQAKVLFSNALKEIYNELLLFGILTIVLILSILMVVTKKRFLSALTYILFPSSLILCYGIFVPLNIMHIFMTFIIIAIGIDYGIYMNEEKLSHNTTIAIVYSLISTFAGFGVLIMSNINSLSSIAITSIIGITGILFLLLFQNRNSINKTNI